MAYCPPVLPYSPEVLDHLLASARSGDGQAAAELERLHEPLLRLVADEFRGLLPAEQLDVCCRFALGRALKAFDAEAAAEGLTLEEMACDWMRLEVEETIRHQHWLR